MKYKIIGEDGALLDGCEDGEWCPEDADAAMDAQRELYNTCYEITLYRIDWLAIDEYPFITFTAEAEYTL